MTEKDYLDPKGYWGDPAGNVRRMSGDSIEAFGAASFRTPYIYRYTARVPRDRFLAFEGEGMTWMRQPSWQESHYFQCAWNFGKAQPPVQAFSGFFFKLPKLQI